MTLEEAKAALQIDDCTCWIGRRDCDGELDVVGNGPDATVQIDGNLTLRQLQALMVVFEHQVRA